MSRLGPKLGMIVWNSEIRGNSRRLKTLGLVCTLPQENNSKKDTVVRVSDF